MTQPLPIIDLTQTPIAPGTTPALSGQLQDQNGNPVPASSLSSLTLTIVDTVTKAVVNGVQDVNILNQGRGTVDGNGNVVVTPLQADTQLLNAAHAKERRSFVLVWTWNLGVSRGAAEMRTLIEALSAS